jgi:hypothetical protein
MPDEQDPKDRPVTIDIETATESTMRPEDVERIRREAGIEEGEPPPRGEPSGSDAEVERREGHGEHDHRIDRALQHRDGPQPG